MKKHIILLFIVCTAHTVSSQNFLSDDKQWNVRNYFWGDIRTEIYWTNGDTLVEGVEYRKLWYSMDSLLQDQFLQGFIREADKQVYYKAFIGPEGLLYDFDLETGDSAEFISLRCSNPIEKTVSAIDTVDYFGYERRRWHFGDESEYWIEGIGSISGVIHSFYQECVFDIGYDLLCYYENEELMYIREYEEDCFQTSVGIGEIAGKEHFQLWPNPASESIMLQTEEDLINREFQIIDTRGCVLMQGMINAKRMKIQLAFLHPGVYFIRFEQPELPVLRFLKF